MSKQRISLTIDEELVERIDKEAEEKEMNRSQTVEEILDKYFKSKGIETALVLCGDPENKTLSLYKGKPVLSHILDQLQQQGINRTILLVGDNKDQIEPHFKSNYKGMAVEYIEEEQPEGTAQALKKAKEKVSKTFVAVNGHVISKIDLKDMTRFHEKTPKKATMALTTVENPSKYGVAKLKGNLIEGFEEKPDPGEEPSRLINAGTYILEPEVFKLLKDTKNLEKLFEKLIRQKELSGYIYGGEWVDIDEKQK